MTGYESKRAAARDRLDSREDYYKSYDDLYVVYLNGVYDGRQKALAEMERNFCERCGKRTPPHAQE